MKRILPLLLLLSACTPQGWTAREREIIAGPKVMNVLVMPQDSVFLRSQSKDLGPKELASEELQILLEKMLATVQDPSQDGVGIAAPQVGVGRRIVCVQRFDKEGEPFEAYVNIRIDSLSGPTICGPEGCLSVPGMRGIVPRSSAVHLSYLTPDGTPRQEKVEGFSAIIFQHECDHLDGILYTDRADSLFVR